MKYRSMLLTAAISLTMFASALASRAGQDYTDPAGHYKFALAGEWRAVSYNDAVGRQKTEFVYRDRAEGLLKISRETLSGPIADVVRQEEETLKVYRAGFEGSSVEPFNGGALNGSRFSFFSTEGGRKMASTHYYLQDKNAVWVLRFAGKRGVLDTARNLTDQMARSFRPL